MPALARRPFLQLSLGGVLTLSQGPRVWAHPRVAPRAESPNVGVDPVFVTSGLTRRWQAAMKQDLGWSAQWSPMDTGDVLSQLAQGQVDAGLFLTHPRADALDQEGLIYSRTRLARTDVLLLGPTTDLAGIRSETDPARALAQVLAAAEAGAARWATPATGSAIAALADRLTHGQASQARPGAPTLKAGVASTPAYRLMTRAQWLKAPPKGERLKVWMADPPAMTLYAEVACSFRARHAGAKLLLSWLQWPLAQSAVKASRPAWQAVKE